MRKELKLFVWENVLTDYTEGIMFALAENADEARRLISEKMEYDSCELKIEPREISEKEGFYVYGGG